MNKGFTITCNKCGKSTVITQKNKKYPDEMRFSNENIKVFATNMEELFISCKCGNEVKEE